MDLKLIIKDPIILISRIHMVKNALKFTKTRRNHITNKNKMLNIQKKQIH